ncbi:aryl hydrocarbon receptor isoform X2 [Amblyraja radiata]|uniref:aryl hydrocarbon receptor isoform X2 n=1 Tax=Amblyraja radiata TaxID=386614 RepID=UPI001401EE13|nr:aryl hydrocarbon receptor isoform X2 [Amblyraja radiata]
MNSSSIYASRKRRKPVQKSAKSLASEGAKSNPSKRHRDRLNAELERLANLLPFPQDIVSRLDKLSVLRLSVSYLRAKSFFNVTLKSNGNGIHENGIAPQPRYHLQEGEVLLQALRGFVLVITAEGLVFYTSSTIQDYLGFHQSDIIHQSVFELIHTEDRPEFQRQLHWALTPDSDELGKVVQGDNGLPLSITHYSPEQLPPENSPFLERNFVCRLRCLLDNSSGFLAMNFQGRLKLLYEQNMKGKDGSFIPPQLALFAIATPLQPPSILEIRTKNFIFRTKHKLDFTPMGCDAKGKIVLGYTEAELCMRGSGYQFIHAADMMYCAENHVRMMKTGESGMTVFRLLTKENGWTWVQANARLGYSNGKPDYIIATQRPLTKEEGEEHLQKRTLQLPFNFATGEALLYEGNCVMLGLLDPKINQIKHTVVAEPTKQQESLDPNSILGAMLRQDRSVYISEPSQHQTFEKVFFNESKDTELSNVYPYNWEELMFNEDNSIRKIDCVQKQKPFPAPEKNVDFLENSIGSELYNTMKNLDIELEDFDLISQDETFLKVQWDDAGDINNIALNDEILNYVQESLKKRSDCMYSSCMQEKPLNSNSNCMTQQQPTTQRLQQQQLTTHSFQQQQFLPQLQQQQQLQVQPLQQLPVDPVQQFPEQSFEQKHQLPPVQLLQQQQHQLPPVQRSQQQLPSMPCSQQQQLPSVQHLQQQQLPPIQHLQQQPPVQHLQQQQQLPPLQNLQQQQHLPPVQHLQQQQQQLATHLLQQQHPIQHYRQQPLPSQHFQQKQHQSRMQHYRQQQQLCQKMKLMKVNGLFRNWNSGSESLGNDQEKQFDFSRLDNTSSGFQYKSELNVANSACHQAFLLYQQGDSGLTQPSDFSQTDVPVDGFHTQNCNKVNGLEDYLDCVQQHSEIQDCSAISPSMDLITPQACYTGAMSMIPCLTESDLPCMDTLQFKSTNPGEQPFLAKQIQTGCNNGNSNEVYPSMFNNVNYTHTAPQAPHDHPREPGPYSNQSSNGFI